MAGRGHRPEPSSPGRGWGLSRHTGPEDPEAPVGSARQAKQPFLGRCTWCLLPRGPCCQGARVRGAGAGLGDEAVLLWEWVAQEAPRGWVTVGGCVCVAVHVHSLGRGCQHMVQVAVMGKIGEWVQGGVNGTVCHCGGAPLGEWGRDLASSGMSSATVFWCGLSCLCPRVSLTSRLWASSWPSVSNTWGRLSPWACRSVGIPLSEFLYVCKGQNSSVP